jgi:hypothetical protein
MEELGRGPELSPVRVNFSAALTTAIALIARRLTPAELAPAWLDEHGEEIRRLAARVRLHHEPEMTAATLLGTLGAGASLDDVSARDLLRIRRRLGDLNMDEANPGPPLLRALGASRRLRRTVLSGLRDRLGGSAGRGGLEGLDVAALRMTFPSRMRIGLRDGTLRTVEGAEPGSCGRPLEEQREVVEEKLRVAAPTATR